MFLHPAEPVVPDSLSGRRLAAFDLVPCAAHRLALSSGCGLDEFCSDVNSEKLFPRFRD